MTDETLVLPRRRELAIVPMRAASVSALVQPRPSAFNDVARSLQVNASLLLCKRIIDVIVAGIALVVLSPVFLILSLAIVLTSDGPALFRQQRFGRNNVPFTLFKFRSMYVDRQDLSGIAQTVDRDPRVTMVGRIIRRTYIDELPQLINVLKGDMSLVGPRAQVMGMRAVGMCYEELVPHYRARHAVRPGITGLAQVRGFRGEIKDIDHAVARVDCDLEYIRRVSVWLDLKILALTIPSVIMGRLKC